MALGPEQIGAVPRPLPIFLEGRALFWHPPQPKNSGLRAGKLRIAARVDGRPRLLYGDRALQLAGQAPFPLGPAKLACALAHRDDLEPVAPSLLPALRGVVSLTQLRSLSPA